MTAWNRVGRRRFSWKGRVGCTMFHPVPRGHIWKFRHLVIRIRVRPITFHRRSRGDSVHELPYLPTRTTGVLPLPVLLHLLSTLEIFRTSFRSSELHCAQGWRGRNNPSRGRSTLVIRVHLPVHIHGHTEGA